MPPNRRVLVARRARDTRFTRPEPFTACVRRALQVSAARHIITASIYSRAPSTGGHTRAQEMNLSFSRVQVFLRTHTSRRQFFILGCLVKVDNARARALLPLRRREGGFSRNKSARLYTRVRLCRRHAAAFFGVCAEKIYS